MPPADLHAQHSHGRAQVCGGAFLYMKNSTGCWDHFGFLSLIVEGETSYDALPLSQPTSEKRPSFTTAMRLLVVT